MHGTVENETVRPGLVMAAPDPSWKRLYPFASHYLQLGALRYHYLDEGTGEPVVMVHGNPTWSFYFRRLVLALRGEYRCIVPDHIGCGLSDKPGDDAYDYRLARRVDDLERLLDHLGLDRGVTLVLHDWGGMIGMACALRKPKRIARLVILNTAAFLLPSSKRFPLRLRLIRSGGPLAVLAVRGLNLFARSATTMATARGLSQDIRDGLIAPYDSWQNRIATLRFVQDIPLRPGDPSYNTVRHVDENLHRFARVPTQICWGMKDFVFDAHFLTEWRRRFPHAEVHEFPDTGHYVLEDAGDRIVPLVKKFLVAGPTPSSASPQSLNPLVPPSLNIASYLPEMARLHPNTKAIIYRDSRGRYQSITFGELNRETDRYAHGLTRAGIRRGMRTLLMVRPNLEFFILTFALYKIGAVPVLIDPGMGKRRMVDCLAAVHAEAFIGIPLAQLLRLSHPAAFRSVRIAVTVGRRLGWGGLSLSDIRAVTGEPYEIASTKADDPAAIIFTTGSTGPPKGVLYLHGQFDAQVRILRDHFKIAPGEIDLPTFPLFALFDPALGMTAVLPEMDPTRPADVDPTKIIGAIQSQNVTHMFGSPALLDRVGRYGEANRITLPSLRRVISAGAPVPPATLERFARMLPHDARIHTPYGATEALPVASIDHTEILGETRHETARGGGTCIGRPVPGAIVRVIRISDEPIEEWSDDLVLPAGEIGEIVVKGPMVTREYCTDAPATRLAKIPDNDGFWHRMGDVGRFDERGRLWFCGRKAHRVITEAGTLFTEPCEAIFSQHPSVYRSALVGVGAPPHQLPIICIELERSATASEQKSLASVLLDLAARHEPTRAVRTILYHSKFPVDIRHNAKIFREKLAVWAAERLR
ncbi:MAG TPA: fatty acid CoA ligase family protein [Phycisphaerae bacterium]|nr:fatty acid CoA ligase family protein [Phycisphaerae bacterium]